MDVSIIIVNYNTLGLTSDCIESIVEKNNIIYLITEFNEIYKFKNNKHYDLIEILMNKNKDIIVGINSDIKKQIKKKYNITLKEV